MDSPLPKSSIRFSEKVALNLGLLVIYAGWIVAHLPLPSDQSILRPVGYSIFLAGVLFAVLGLAKRSLANVILILSSTSVPLIELIRPRWTPITLLAWYSLAILLNAPKWLASLRKFFLHWKQTIKELNAASKL